MKKITSEEFDEERRATGGSGIDGPLKGLLLVVLVLLLVVLVSVLYGGALGYQAIGEPGGAFFGVAIGLALMGSFVFMCLDIVKRLLGK